MVWTCTGLYDEVLLQHHFITILLHDWQDRFFLSKSCSDVFAIWLLPSSRSSSVQSTLITRIMSCGKSMEKVVFQHFRPYVRSQLVQISWHLLKNESKTQYGWNGLCFGSGWYCSILLYGPGVLVLPTKKGRLLWYMPSRAERQTRARIYYLRYMRNTLIFPNVVVAQTENEFWCF